MCLVLMMLLAEALSKPLLAFDARAIWGMKAKILFYERGIYGEDFLDPERLHFHQRYPLLLPLAQCFIYHFIGGVDDRYVKVIFPIFFVSLSLSFYAMLRRFFGRSYCMAATTMLMTLPAYVIFENGGVNSGNADVPLAYFCFNSVVSLFRYLFCRASGHLLVAALFGAFTIFTKQEGLALWLLTLACFVSFASALGLRRIAKSFLFMILLTVLLLLPWFHYRSQLPAIDEDYFSRLNLESVAEGTPRLPFVFRSFLKEFFFKPHLWNIFGILVLTTLCFSPLKTLWQPHSVFLWIPLIYRVLLSLVFLITPWRVEELVPVSLTRLMIHVAPLIMAWLFFQVANCELLPNAWTKHR